MEHSETMGTKEQTISQKKLKTLKGDLQTPITFLYSFCFLKHMASSCGSKEVFRNKTLIFCDAFSKRLK